MREKGYKSILLLSLSLGQENLAPRKRGEQSQRAHEVNPPEPCMVISLLLFRGTCDPLLCYAQTDGSLRDPICRRSYIVCVCVRVCVCERGDCRPQ